MQHSLWFLLSLPDDCGAGKIMFCLYTLATTPASAAARYRALTSASRPPISKSSMLLKAWSPWHVITVCTVARHISTPSAQLTCDQGLCASRDGRQERPRSQQQLDGTHDLYEARLRNKLPA
jgi:hypothetical protein